MVATTGSVGATIAAVEALFALFMGALAGMAPTP